MAALRPDLVAAASRIREHADPRTRAARSTPSTGTACCARTARDRSAFAAGTGSSNAGWPRSSRPRRARGTSGGRCSRPRTTTPSTSTTARSAWWSDEACAGGCSSPGRARSGCATSRPAARRGRDDARDDHPQGPGQPGRPGHRAAAGGGARGCSRASCSTPPSPGLHPARRRHRGRRPRRCHPAAPPVPGWRWLRIVRLDRLLCDFPRSVTQTIVWD